MNTTGKKQIRKNIKQRLYKIDKSQAYLARVFRCTPQQITQALLGGQPTLLKKIKNHLHILETKNHKQKETIQ